MNTGSLTIPIPLGWNGTDTKVVSPLFLLAGLLSSAQCQLMVIAGPPVESSRGAGHVPSLPLSLVLSKILLLLPIPF